LEVNWSTFLLEIINFVVLVWILKRFLYKPVLDIIAKRRADIEKTVADAKAVESDAKALQQRYENRLAEWETERRQAREALGREIDEERSRRMSELQAALEQEREKAKVSEQKRLADSERRVERAALAHGARFAARLVTAFASPDLQARLLERLLAELSELPAERAAELIGSAENPPSDIVITSAFSLAQEQRQRLRDALANLTQREIRIAFKEDPGLVAGLRIMIGAWVLGLNVHDELEGFARLADGEG
jgi:F-type H+-transporting ATPase subunit b